MKKVSKYFIFCIALFSAIFVSACGKPQKQEIIFSTNNVIINLGDEESAHTVNARLVGINVDSLSLSYDNTYFEVESSEKSSDNSFDLIIIPKGEMYCNDIEVTVTAGGRIHASFKVSIVIPVSDIIVANDLFVPFDGKENAVINLYEKLTFVPDGTEQNNVEFLIYDGNTYVSAIDGIAKIEGEYLIIDKNLTSFNNIKILSQSLNNSSISKEFEVKVVPSTIYLADQISMQMYINGSYQDITLNTINETLNGINLSIKKDPNSNIYELSTFKLKITIPKSLGVGVKVDRTESTNNVMAYLNEFNTSYPEGENVITEFNFNSVNLKSCIAELFLKFYYEDKVLNAISSLSSNFINVSVDNEKKVHDKLYIFISVPVESLSVKINDQLFDGSIIDCTIYNFYSSSKKGSEFVFNTNPNNSTDQTFKINSSLDNVKLLVWNATEYKELLEGDTFSAGETIYVRGEKPGIGRFKVNCGGKELQVNCTINVGASTLGFVSGPNELNTTKVKSIAMEMGAETNKDVYIYAPGTNHTDLYCEGLKFEPIPNGYYITKIKPSEVGEKTYNIYTNNGFEITLNVTTIQPITNAIVKLKEQLEGLTGIGKMPVYDANESLQSIAVKYGYTAQLNYLVNENADISGIQYSFVDMPINRINVYSNKYQNFGHLDEHIYQNTSSIISSQNIKNANIITGVSEGKAIVRAMVYGYKVVNDMVINVAEYIETYKGDETKVEIINNLMQTVQVKYFVVEVYKPAIDIIASGKTVALRSQSDLKVEDYKHSTTTIDLSALANSNDVATYNKIFIDQGELTETGIKFTSTSTSDFGELKYEGILSVDNKLTITVYSVPKDFIFENALTITLFIADFYVPDVTYFAINNVPSNYTVIPYVININVLLTEKINDINVTSLKLINEKTIKTDEDGKILEPCVKTYEEVYLDTLSVDAGKTNVYKIVTSISPLNAFDKKLKYTFVPDLNTVSGLVDLADNNGNVYYSGAEGGSGKIIITPDDTENNSIMVIIPIVIADGKTETTAFRITNLNEITNSTKHYEIISNGTLNLDKTIFDGETFTGGLYGNGATIHLNNCTLFDKIGAGATVKGLILCGNAKGTGFVANSNAGTIDSINVEPYIVGGKYIPSLLTPNKNDAYVGGIVGTNETTGTISNCTYAGSIKKLPDTQEVDSICGENKGTLTDNKVRMARFNHLTQNEDRVLECTEQDDNFEGYYINGVITSYLTGTMLPTTPNASLEEPNFLTGNECINDVAGKALGALKDADGNILEKGYGIVFYYEAEDSSKQDLLKNYNIIEIEDLIGSNVKVLAYNPDGTVCNFVTINSNGQIEISGVGEFTLKVYSSFDFRDEGTVNIKMLSIYYMDKESVGIYNDGYKYENGNEIKIVNGSREQVYSSSTTEIEGIKLKKNNFDIVFAILTKRADGSDYLAGEYITGNKFGYHTINAYWGEVSLELQISLLTGYNSEFDAILNNCYFNEFKLQLDIAKGTTKIETDSTEGSIEPKDSITFNAIITTDMINADGSTSDYINLTTITITNDAGYTFSKDEKLNPFDIYISKEAEKVENKFAFEITVSLKDKYKSNLDYVNRIYTIKVQARNNVDTYGVFTTYKLNILPQTLSNIAVTVYNFTSANGNTNYVQTEPPVSVIKPSDTALLVVDMFPSFASFDYVEITASSNTLAKLSYRVQKRQGNSYAYDSGAKVESLADVNGIKIYNNFVDEIKEQYIGSYYIMIFADNTLNVNAIFNITVNAYYNGQKLEKNATFTLYVKAPEKPQISVNGKTSIYAYPLEEISATVRISADQTITMLELIDNNKTSLDFAYTLEKLTIQNDAEYVNYKLNFVVPKMDITQNTNKIHLWAHSYKVYRGEIVNLKDELIINIVPFKTPENSIIINGEMENIFNVTSVKYLNLQLLANVLYGVQEKENNELKTFKENYYLNNNFGFEIGNNLESLEKYKQKAVRLASYLYYVEGNTYSPVLNSTTGAGGRINYAFAHSLSYSKIIGFNFKEIKNDEGKIEDYVLQVKGGEQTGEVPMLLRMYYTTPDGATFVYEHKFTFINSLYTTEDMPKEINSATAFKQIENEKVAHDYILSNDIYLYNYNPIKDTKLIKSLDGNNYTIHIMSFEENDSSSKSIALFNTISNSTTIKNLTVNYYYLKEILLKEEVQYLDFAGFAITNNGIIYNCEVLAFSGNETTPTFSTYGLKVLTSEMSTATINASGFVINNTGSITNSRVGGQGKLVTSFDYSNEGNPTLKEVNKTARTFTIRAPGTISGFVMNNSTTGIISSSYAKNINILNTYNKGETKVTSGFVNTNDGSISMSYVEGVKLPNEIQASGSGIEASGIMAGFVYTNNNKISDCYSNIMLHSISNQVGRFGAGFVYLNSTKANISTSYSFSKVSGNNTTQLNFCGITDLMEYNNFGTIKSCYYYLSEDVEQQTIETMFNTEILTVKNVADILNFYGFSFASQNAPNLIGTWVIDEYGPKLHSAENITHSVRYKQEDKNNKNNSLDYIFVYDQKYDYGTRNNPIIIRDAKEFNGAFGGYNGTNTEIEENFTLNSKKIYGDYRIVNNINLTELIVNENEETDYKYNLVSTKFTLSGEMSETANRTGSINGNSMSITGLAISNEETSGSSDYGIFKTIENGASISNVNIVLAKGGIKADNTTCVGTLAGTLSDSALVNINISTNGPQENAEVIGSNIVGGAVGRVIKNSYIFGVTTNNISVTATYYQNENVDVTDAQRVNLYERNDSKLKNKSLAGGVFGVVDIYTQGQEVTDKTREEDDTRFANVQRLSVTGNMTISGMTVGGLMGYTGKYVIAKDLSLIITNTGNKQAKLIAYECYAGGIVGFNRGYLYQVLAVHENKWQAQIEQNMYSYYEGEQNINRGNEELFTSKDVEYKPVAIGGIVGVMDNGIISIGYSKIHVKNDYANYAGGVVGLINAPNKDDETKEFSAQLNEVYSTSDVYANAEGRTINTNSYIGGIIGKNDHDALQLNKVNALNYWSNESLNNDGISIFVNQLMCSVESDTITATQIGCLENVMLANKEKALTINLVTGIVIEDKNKITIPTYKGYKGLAQDNGTQVDTAFELNEWYETDNWVRDNNELYPHIRYTSPTSIYEIYSTNDFWRFGRYGSDANAKFIVTYPGLINCAGKTRTYPTLKGTLIGQYENSGFSNLEVPLFKTISGKVQDLIFSNCLSPIANTALEKAKFTYLQYKDCNFNKVQTKSSDSVNNNLAGVVYEVQASQVEFSNITFYDCSLTNANATTKAVNAGMLFANGIATTQDSSVKASYISVINQKELCKEVYEGSNVGVLFGNSLVTVNLSNIGISLSETTKKISLNINELSSASSEPTAPASETVTSTTVGYIGGKLSNVKLEKINITQGELIVNSGAEQLSSVVCVGGLVGNATNVELIVTEDEQTTGQDFFNANINVNGIFKEIYAGGLIGKTEEFTYSLEKNTIVSSQNSSVLVSVGTGLTAVGGICGYANSISFTEGSKGYLVYNGDVLINQIGPKPDATATSSTIKSSGDAYIGGFVGYIGGDSTISKFINNGSIAFTNSNQNTATYYIGGVIGAVMGGLTSISNTYGVGDIMLMGSFTKGSTTQNYKFNSSKNACVGGLIGQNQATTEFGEKTFSLTSISYMPKTDSLSAISVDAVANNNNTSTIKNLTNVNYASNVNLCVSSVQDSKSEVANNKLYKDIEIDISVKELFANIKGSKLNPITFDEITTQSFSEDICSVAKENGILQIKGNPSSRRRVFVKYESQTSVTILQNPISLVNAVMFSDGGEIYSNFTPFDVIDENSAVSGIIVKIKADQNKKTFDSKEYISTAGFINENNGVIFTCSVQEPLNYFNEADKQTDFYATLTATQTTNSISGFANTNKGYIFGSSSNVHIISTSNVTNIAGFSANNTGIIESSYAHGYASLGVGGSVSNLMLFDNNYTPTAPSTPSVTATASTTTPKGKVINCYTIFANQIGEVESITVSDGCYYEEQAIESGIALVNDEYKTTLYKDNSKLTYNEINYFKVDLGYNYSYPYLGAGPFANLTYVQKYTTFYQIETQITDDIDAGTKVKIYELQPTNANDVPKVEDDVTANYVYGVSTLSAFTGLENSKNYTLTRSINLGYLMPKGEGQETYPQKEWKNTLISELKSINLFGNGNYLNNLNLNNLNLNNLNLNNVNLIGTLGEDSTITGLNINNVNLKNSTGIIGTNNGTISSANIQGNVNILYTAENTAGTLVGTNNGCVDFVSISATIKDVSMDNAQTPASYTFGGLVGNNAGNINSCTASSQVSILTAKAVNITFGGIVGTNSGKVISCGANGLKTTVHEDYINKVNYGNNTFAVAPGIISSGVVCVGGIVGIITTNGEVSACYTTEATTISGGVEQMAINLGETEDTNKNDIIDNGNNYFATKQSFVGGIIGSATFNNGKYEYGEEFTDNNGNGIYDEGEEFTDNNNPTIQDCSNSATVCAMAKWNLIDTDFRYQYDSSLGQRGSIIVYASMSSNAYAGGIMCSGALNDTNIEVTNENVDNTGKTITRLKNTGNVYGGYVAWKPIAMLQTIKNQPTEINWGKVFAGSFISIWETLNYTHDYNTGKAKEIVEEELNATKIANVNISMFYGNSERINIDGFKDALNKTIKDDNSYCFKDDNDLINLNNAFEFTTMADNLLEEGLKLLVDAYLSYLKSRQIAKFMNNEHCGDTILGMKIGETDFIPLSEPVANLYYDHKKTDTHKLSGIYYDGICPGIDIASESWGNYNSPPVYNVFSEIKNYDDVGETKVKAYPGEISVPGLLSIEVNGLSSNTGIITGAKLHTNNLSNQQNTMWKDYYDIGTTKPYSFIENCVAWNKTDSNNDGKWGDDELITSRPNTIKNIETDDKDNYVYTLTNPANWDNIVETINSNENYQKDNFKLNIEFGNDAEEINVGDYILNNFNGEFNVKVNKNGVLPCFTGLKISVKDGDANQENTVSYGLIKNSSSAVINNLIYIGDVQIADRTYNSKTTFNYGTIIANASENVTFNNCQVVITNLNIENSLTNRIIGIGGYVGTNSGELNINNSLVKIHNFNAETKTISPSNNNCSFGGYIASVNSGNVIITKANVNINNAVVLTNISYAGGIIGFNQGSVTLAEEGEINLHNFNFASINNAYVGGVIGYNKGSLTTDDLKINTNQPASSISADVVNETGSAYVGGVVGYNENDNADSISLANINIGQKAENGYEKLSYILAGFNKYSNSYEYHVLPSEAHSGSIIGSGTATVESKSIINTIVRARSKNAYNKSTDILIEETPKDEVNTTDSINGYEIKDNGKTISFNGTFNEGNDAAKINNSYTYSVVEKSYYKYNSNDNLPIPVYEFDLSFKNICNLQTPIYKYEDIDNNGKYEKVASGDFTTLNATYSTSYKIVITRENSTVSNLNGYVLRLYLTSEPKYDNDGKFIIGKEDNCVQTTEVNKLIDVIDLSTVSSGGIEISNSNEFFNKNIISLQSYNEVVDNKNTDDTEDDITIYSISSSINSKGIKIAMDGSTLSIQENLIVSSQKFTADDKTIKEDTTDISRTLFTCTLEDETGLTFTETDCSSLIPTGGGNVINGVIYSGDKLLYQGEEVVKLRTYTGTRFGKDILIVSTTLGADGNYKMVELIYEKGTSDSNYKYRGKLEYNLNLSEDQLNKLKLTRRYESYLPNLSYNNGGEDGYYFEDKIFNIKVELLTNGEVVNSSEVYNVGGLYYASISPEDTLTINYIKISGSALDTGDEITNESEIKATGIIAEKKTISIEDALAQNLVTAEVTTDEATKTTTTTYKFNDSTIGYKIVVFDADGTPLTTTYKNQSGEVVDNLYLQVYMLKKA